MKRLTLLMFISSLCFGADGHDVGHGGDFITIENNPWFIGEAPVTYCISQSGDFSATREAIDSAVKNVLDDWSQTMQRLHPVPTEQNLLDGKQKSISTQFVKLGSCDDTTDLTFLMGVFNGAVVDDLAHRAKYSVAFAAQSSFDEATGRAKGFIWIAPDKGPDQYRGPKSRETGFWSDSSTLYNILLHEVGHAMGLQHQEGVMSESLPADLVATGSTALYTSLFYANQRWTRLRERPGKKLCGPISSESQGILARLFGSEIPGGTLSCLQWGRDAKSLTLQVAGRSLDVHELSEYSTPALKDVTGCYRRNDRPEGSWPLCHQFIEPDSDVLLSTVEARGEKFSVVVSTQQTEIRLNFIDSNQAHAGWFGIFLTPTK